MRLLIWAASLAIAVPLIAQIDNGNITGRVTDPSGAAIVGAQVTLLQTAMNFETAATTNEEGIYRALSLRPGPYRITVAANGFKKLVRDDIDLRISQTLGVNLSLEIGSLSDSIEVSAKAQLLDTETSSSGATLAGEYFYSLPNYQHHPQMVLLFTPGISFGSNQYTATMSGMSVDGIGSGDVGYFEDGTLGTMGGRSQQQITNTETVLNSIEDIKVFTSAMPAEYGHSAGVGISIVKKSGTNTLHGLLLTLGTYLKLSSFDSSQNYCMVNVHNVIFIYRQHKIACSGLDMNYLRFVKIFSWK
jgi:hypothetical protein